MLDVLFYWQNYLPDSLAKAIQCGGWICFVIGVFLIARSRAIARPWLAFIPFADTYYLGKVGADIRAEQGKKARYALFLLLGEIATTVLLLFIAFGNRSFWVQRISHISLLDRTIALFTTSLSPDGFTAVAIELCAIVCVALAWIMAVYRQVVYYRFYQRYNHSKRILFLVLSVLVPTLSGVFFLNCAHRAGRELS